MKDSNYPKVLVVGDNSATFMLEEYLQNFLFYNSPMDARIEIQHTSISDVFSPDYKEQAQDLHSLLCAYCFEKMEHIEFLEKIIEKQLIISEGNLYFINYYDIFRSLDDKGEIEFLQGSITLDEFVSRYRVLCAVDGLVGIGNSLWALDNLRKFKFFLNERAANVLVKESHAITRNLSAFYTIKMHTQLYKTEHDNSILKEEIVNNLQKHSSEIRNTRKKYLRSGIQKLLTAYKIAKVDTRYFSNLSMRYKQQIGEDKNTRSGWSSEGGRNKAYQEDLTDVIASFIKKHPCENIEIFKDSFAKIYHDGNPCTLGKRKYMVSREDRLFYRENLGAGNVHEYTDVPSSTLEKAFANAQKKVKENSK